MEAEKEIPVKSGAKVYGSSFPCHIPKTALQVPENAQEASTCGTIFS